MYTRIQTTSTPELLASQIREAVANGEIAAGEPLHQEVLAARFGVSRSPVREALRLLESEGVIVYHSNKGAVVAQTTAADIEEMFEIRALLEPMLMRHLASTVDPASVGRWKGALERFEREDDPRTWLALHAAFHEEINTAAKRDRTAAIIRQNRALVAQRDQAGPTVATIRKQLEGCDRKLLSALSRRDPDAAARAVDAHVRYGRKSALALTART